MLNRRGCFRSGKSHGCLFAWELRRPLLLRPTQRIAVMAALIPETRPLVTRWRTCMGKSLGFPDLYAPSCITQLPDHRSCRQGMGTRRPARLARVRHRPPRGNRGLAFLLLVIFLVVCLDPTLAGPENGVYVPHGGKDPDKVVHKPNSASLSSGKVGPGAS